MTVKLAPEDLAAVIQLGEDYAQVKFAIGDISTQMNDLELKLAELDADKYDHLETYKTIVERDKALNTKLAEKYGKGAIDVARGELTID